MVQGTVTLRDTSTGEETEVDAATLTLALRQEVRPLLWEREQWRCVRYVIAIALPPSRHHARVYSFVGFLT